jgi:hypothetical protein
MNPISSIIRIVCGLGIVIVAVSMYRKISAQVAAGGEVQLMGHALGSPGALQTVFVVVGLVGVVLLILGIAGFLKAR